MSIAGYCCPESFDLLYLDKVKAGRKVLEEELDEFPATYPLDVFYGKDRCTLSTYKPDYCLIAAHLISSQIPELEVVAGTYTSGFWSHVFNEDVDRGVFVDVCHDRFPFSVIPLQEFDNICVLPKKNKILKKDRFETKYAKESIPRKVDELIPKYKSKLNDLDSS